MVQSEQEKSFNDILRQKTDLFISRNYFFKRIERNTF